MSLKQLSQLLPLPDEELQQVLDYAATLAKAEAVSHFTNLLGDSPQAIEFISSFNGRRQGPASANNASSSSPGLGSSRTPAASNPADDGPPKSKRSARSKTKAPLHVPEARKVDSGFVPPGTAYNKKTADLEYIPQRGASAPSSSQASRSSTPKLPQPPQPPQPKQTTHAGYLISEAISKPKPKSNPVSRSSTPKPFSAGTTKVSITGGTPMTGASAAIADLDAAIRALEITTNPTLDDPVARRCDCVATRHPLQTAAPNCMSCGKVICVREGLGPCTYCGTPLLSSEEVQGMVRELKEERGRERMAADAEAHRRPAVSKTPAPFTKPRDTEASATSSSLSEAEAKARQHRDKLLNFQAQNARRTTVRDEAADFDVTRGGSMWATPEERAKELKQQQKLMREMEWNARPEYEKRRQVVSIDLVGGKVVRRMAAVERPASPENQDAADEPDDEPGVLKEVTGNTSTGNKSRGGGAFSGNPLLGKLIKPTFEANTKGKEKEAEGRPTKKGWRRVQDDLDDNEAVILDGGVRGHTADHEAQVA